jgi:hypothetical protein
MLFLVVVMLGLSLAEPQHAQSSSQESGQSRTTRTSDRKSLQERIKLASVHVHSSRANRLADRSRVCGTVVLMAGGKFPLFAGLFRNRRSGLRRTQRSGQLRKAEEIDSPAEMPEARSSRDRVVARVRTRESDAVWCVRSSCRFTSQHPPPVIELYSSGHMKPRHGPLTQSKSVMQFSLPGIHRDCPLPTSTHCSEQQSSALVHNSAVLKQLINVPHTPFWMMSSGEHPQPPLLHV